jgi:hypothetical protein
LLTGTADRVAVVIIFCAFALRSVLDAPIHHAELVRRSRNEIATLSFRDGAVLMAACADSPVKLSTIGLHQF